MSETLTTLEKPKALPVKELGAVACAGCPFAQLGCPKLGSGDCPPPQVVEAKTAAQLLSDDSVADVYSGGGGFYGLKAKELLFQEIMPPKPAPKKSPPPKNIPKKTKKAEPLQTKNRKNLHAAERAPGKNGGLVEALGQLAAALLLPLAKTK